MPDTLPTIPTGIVIAALASACGVLYYDNKYLIKELLRIVQEATAASKETTAAIQVNSASVDRMTEEIRRGS